MSADPQDWVGRSESRTDTVAAAPVRMLAGALDRDDPAPGAGDPLPPLWHWLSFLPAPRASETGVDGHPKRGGFLPPVDLPRRMWAGSRLEWEPGNTLRIGDAMQRRSEIVAVKRKEGRSGVLVFVTVRHCLSNGHGLAVTEEQDLVYRDAPRPGDPAPAPVAEPRDASWRRDVTPDEVMLFRYSALTFNGHRIHYDRPYATAVEGYPGLVVHGPLQATLLTDLLRREASHARLRRFSFQAQRPAFDGRPLGVRGRPAGDGRSVELWTEDHEGWLCMKASAEIEP